MAEQSAEKDEQDAAMRAFVAGWFAHARNPGRLVVEEAWHAFRIGDLCPGCLLKPCACPLDDSAARAIFERAASPEQPPARPDAAVAAGGEGQ